jgi:hypothetical protein
MKLPLPKISFRKIARMTCTDQIGQTPNNADHWFDTQLEVSTLTGIYTKSVTYTLNLDHPMTTTGSFGLRAVLFGGQDI